MRLNTEHLNGLLTINPDEDDMPVAQEQQEHCSQLISDIASPDTSALHADQTVLKTIREVHNKASDRSSGYVVGLKNELTVLLALAKFHWLTSRQIGMWVWPTGTQSLQMAQTTLRRLKVQGEVIEKMLPNGVPAYTLSNRGAMRIRAELNMEIHAKRFRHPGHWMHRAICNWHLILFNRFRLNNPSLVDRLAFYSEYEIRRHAAPIYALGGKIPDALVRYTDDDGLESLWWVEVENARRSKKDIAALCDFAVLKLPEYAQQKGCSVRMLQLVSTDIRLLQEVARHLYKRMDSLAMTEDQKLKATSCIELYILDISPGLKTTGYRYFKVPLHDLAELSGS